jgi:hypothetical protein
MLFICYFEIMPEKIAEVQRRTVEHSGDADAPVKIIFEGVSASRWGIAAFEADSEEAVFRFIRPWASANGTLMVAPALRVDNGDYARRFPRELLGAGR